MTDLLAEVDEMMRQERIVKLWKDHGGTLIATVAAIIIGTGLVSGYKAWDKSARMKSTDALLAVLEDPAFPNNISEDTLDVRPGLRGIGLLSAAAKNLAEGKTDAAIALYQQAADERSIPADIRGLALLNLARLSKEPAEARLEILAPVMKDQNSPWRYHAYMEAAVIEAHENQDYAAAMEHLNVIQDAPNMPESLYNKARALGQVYALKTGTPETTAQAAPEAAPEAAAAEPAAGTPAQD